MPKFSWVKVPTKLFNNNLHLSVLNHRTYSVSDYHCDIQEAAIGTEFVKISHEVQWKVAVKRNFDWWTWGYQTIIY